MNIDEKAFMDSDFYRIYYQKGAETHRPGGQNNTFGCSNGKCPQFNEMRFRFRYDLKASSRM